MGLCCTLAIAYKYTTQSFIVSILTRKQNDDFFKLKRSLQPFDQCKAFSTSLISGCLRTKYNIRSSKSIFYANEHLFSKFSIGTALKTTLASLNILTISSTSSRSIKVTRFQINWRRILQKEANDASSYSGQRDAKQGFRPSTIGRLVDWKKSLRILSIYNEIVTIID